MGPADVSTFGDWEPDDALDHEPADPEKVEEYRELLRRRRTPPSELEERVRAWLHEQGADG